MMGLDFNWFHSVLPCIGPFVMAHTVAITALVFVI